MFFGQLERNRERKQRSVFVVSTPENPNSCLIKLQQLQYRALVDSGAEVSLISEKAYLNLKHSVPLEKKRFFYNSHKHVRYCINITES